MVGNDSVQTLGTFIASNRRAVQWYWLWLGASVVLVGCMLHSWILYDGDISHGRLDKIPAITIEWYHAAAPAVLVLLTRAGIPVSTTFLVLSTFSTAVVMESMLVKSVLGYGLAAIVAYVSWLVLAHFMNERFNITRGNKRKTWQALQWLSTGFLWYTWLAHDLANIAVFLPRQLSLELFIMSAIVMVAWLGYIFYTHGGKIQEIVLEKTGSRYIRSATIIDFIYALILWYFKELNNVPMSTTWVFVGLLSGRELAIATVHRTHYQLRNVFPIVGKDFLKIMIGLGISIAMVLAIHGIQ